jgi:hypothetical protein
MPAPPSIARERWTCSDDAEPGGAIDGRLDAAVA